MFEKIKTLEEFVAYIRTKLGEPKTRVELSDSQIHTNLHDAVQLYREYSSENGNWRSFLVLDTTRGQQKYTLPEEVMSVISSKRSRNTSAWVLAQLSGAAASDVLNLKQFDMVSFVMLNHWLRYLRIITPSPYRFFYNNNIRELTIMPTPSKDEKIFLEVINMATLDELYDERWIKDYTLSLCQILLGDVRSKMGSLPGFGGQITLNGGDLVQRGEDDKKRLEDELILSFKFSRPPFPVFHI